MTRTNTPAPGVPTVIQGEITSPTRNLRRPKRNTYDVIVELGWKPTVQLALLVGGALAALALGADELAYTLAGVAGGSLVPAWPRTKH